MPKKMVAAILLLILSFSKYAYSIDKSKIIENYNKMPLSFTESTGQFAFNNSYIAQGNDATIYLSNKGITFLLSRLKENSKNYKEQRKVEKRLKNEVSATELEYCFLNLTYENSNVSANTSAENLLTYKTNYFIGNNPSNWRANVKSYSNIRVKDIYEGIDLIYYGNREHLKYDFIIREGYNPEQIVLTYEGAKKISLLENGDLQVQTRLGNLIEKKPVAYQEINGENIRVNIQYEILGPEKENSFTFKIGEYNKGYQLVIDPEIDYTLIIGKSGWSNYNTARAVYADEMGFAYITGCTHASYFPTTPGAFDTTFNGGYDAFIAKVNQDGSDYVYSTYIGGTGSMSHGDGEGYDFAMDIAVDNFGNSYITGYTNSTDFPTTIGAYDESYNGNGWITDVFVCKLNSTGDNLLFSTYIGEQAEAYGIDIDSNKNVYITGTADQYHDYPTTSGAYKVQSSGGYYEVFVTKLNSTGSDLTYSTLIGDGHARDICVDNNGNAYFTGHTFSTDFPTTEGAFDREYSGEMDVFITKLNSNGTALISSTLIGSDDYDSGESICIDQFENIYVTGETWSLDFPVSNNAFHTTLENSSDAIVCKFSSDCKFLVYSTYLNASSGQGIALDDNGLAYITGFYDPPEYWLESSFLTALNSSGTDTLFFYSLGIDAKFGICLDESKNIYVCGSTDRYVWGMASLYKFHPLVAELPSAPTIIFPNESNVVLELNQECVIKWEYSSQIGDLVKIDLLKSGQYYRTIVENADNQGYYIWKVSEDISHGTDYKIRISSVTNPSILDLSDNYFEINVPAEFRINYPNESGVVWQANQEYTITWSSFGVAGAHVNIDLYKGNNKERTIALSTDNDGAFTYRIIGHQTPGSDYRIKITSVEYPEVFDFSDNNFTIQEPAQITVTDPSTVNISWQAGESYNITWTSTGDPGQKVKIELFQNDTYSVTISDSTLNNGAFLWSIPLDQTTGSDFKVKISSCLYPDVSDLSDYPFTILAPVPLKITSPSNSGIVWQAGVEYLIEWTTFGDVGTDIKIELYRSDAYDRTITDNTPNTGSFNWLIPYDTEGSTSYKVKISSISNPSISDFSDNTFQIMEAPTIEITYPSNQGIVWKTGQEYTIRWNAIGIFGHLGSYVRIDLYKGESIDTVLAKSTLNDGTYNWLIPENYVNALHYRIKVSSTVDSLICDFSDNPFSIQEPSQITVLHPDSAGIFWQANQEFQIKWSSTEKVGPSVKIELFDDATLNLLISEDTENDGSFDWFIPINQQPSPNYKIKITSKLDTSYYDFSDNPFTIQEPAQIFVTNPDSANTVLFAGLVCEIKWLSVNDPGQFVRIDLYKGAIHDRIIESSTENDGFFMWFLPNDLAIGDDYLIKISSIIYPSIFDFSNNYFTINELPALYVLFPSTLDSSVYAGQEIDIQWYSTDRVGDYVKIDLLLNDTLSATISSSAQNTGLYTWLIPVNQKAETNYKIKITSIVDTSLHAESFFPFTIKESPFIHILFPDSSGIEWKKGLTYDILWNYSGDPGQNVKIELYQNYSLSKTISDSTINDGLYKWTVPLEIQAANNYRIKISSLSIPNVYDYSNQYFSIQDIPQLKVINPDSLGITWYSGITYPITWSSLGNVGPSISIKLLQNNEEMLTIKSNTTNNGIFYWEIPLNQQSGDNFKIKINSANNQDIFDVSDNVFSIEEKKEIVITHPDSTNICWITGNTYNITWNATGNIGPYVKIELLKNDLIQQAINFSAENNGYYQWLVPTLLEYSDSYKIKVSSTLYPAIFDISENYFIITNETSIAENGITEFQYHLYPNYPNPFNPHTTIAYEISKISYVQISIYNMLGHLVRTIVSEEKTPGRYQIMWDGKDTNNQFISSGVFIVEMKADNYVKRIKITFIK